MTSQALQRAESLIATIPDFPEPGILFRDISPLLADAPALRASVDALIEPFAGRFDVVAGIEARGFLLAGAVAIAAGVGMAPIRKAGKLPRPAASTNVPKTGDLPGTGRFRAFRPVLGRSPALGQPARRRHLPVGGATPRVCPPRPVFLCGD